jgi:hypothetical protein
MEGCNKTYTPQFTESGNKSEDTRVLDVHESVHRDIIMNTTNEMQLWIIIPSHLYMFRPMFSPIIRST